MSRIGKKPIPVPSGVKVNVGDHDVSVEGPKGTLCMKRLSLVNIVVDDEAKAVKVSIDEANTRVKAARASWGTTRALINNMIQGVTKGYEKGLEVVGVGWTASVQGQQLKLMIGFANPIFVDIPQGLDVTVARQNIKVSGADKQAVGQFAAAVRAKRKPEPYNGKGIKYIGEVVRRKQGKQFGA